MRIPLPGPQIATRRPAAALAVAAAFLCLAPDPGAAQSAERTAGALPTLHAAPLSDEIRIDGRLDEPAWQAAAVATDFVQQRPHTGQPASQRTEARVIYGPEALYVGMRMYDSEPDRISGQLTRRDAWSSVSDWAMVIIDSRFDRRSAFGFAVNPVGVKHDNYFFDDSRQDMSWVAVWDVAVSLDSLGWTAEFRIPYSQLRFSPSDGEMTWGIQFLRDIARDGERSHWAPMDPNAAGIASRFGYLRGLEGLRPARGLELLPYTSARLDRTPAEPGNPFHRTNQTGAGLGVDVKAGLPAGLTLAATINPDFGQVEVDPAQINLGAFELFFPEQRPFFTEGADVFQFGNVQSFNIYGFERFSYSRRIGRAPQRTLSPARFGAVDAPDQTTILGAAKISGRTDGGWSVGLMNAVAAREQARFATADGETGTALVEPLSNYFTARLRRDVRQGQSVVGGILTATNRDLSDAALQPLYHSDAYLGGLDFEHRWANRHWALSGFVAASHVAGSADAISRTQRAPSRYFARPDAEYLSLDPERTSLGGTMANIALQRSGDWDMSINYKQVSPGFEINDAGFQGRVDYRAITSMVGQRFPRPHGIFRNASYFVGTVHAWNYGGDRFVDMYGTGANGQFRNFWNFGLNINRSPGSMDDRLTRGGPTARTPASWQMSGNLGTDPRRAVRLTAAVNQSLWDDGSHSRQAMTNVSWRPTTYIEALLGPSVSWNGNRRQYVRAFGDPEAEPTFGQRIVFADLDQTTVAANLRLNWTFTPNLSLQLFAQPYVSAGAYSGLKEFTTPGDTRFAVYGQDRGTVCRYAGAYAIQPTRSLACPVERPGAAAADELGFRLLGDPDFTFRSLRGNAVLRWEYRPGSALFVVWQQDRSGQYPYGDLQWSRDPADLLREPGRHVFLVKATYWIGR
jgi:hypothetical protein